MKNKKLFVFLGVALALGATGVLWDNKFPSDEPFFGSSKNQIKKLNAELKDKLRIHVAYRQKLIVLYADDATLNSEDRDLGKAVGFNLFHENTERQEELLNEFSSLVANSKFDAIEDALDFMESSPEFLDADRLAFKELFVGLKDSVVGLSENKKNVSLKIINLHKRLQDDLGAMIEIERFYEKELGQIFNPGETRGIQLKRERWEDYLLYLKRKFNRSNIISDSGIQLSDLLNLNRGKGEETEIFGKNMAPKTIAFTFDDGPHPKYTEEILSILSQYGAPSVFFQVGRNLGTVDANGKAKLSANASVDFKILDQSHAIANHSTTHAQLTKLTGKALRYEIESTDVLLKAVSSKRSSLFRFPYGARNSEGMGIVSELGLKSVMWNIDSLDWADPVPASIANRVLQQIEKEGKGVVLFHDIHAKTVKALSIVLGKLKSDGYQFAGWDGQQFTVSKTSQPALAQNLEQPNYSKSWAVVVGINEYEKWPKLHYASKDADAIKATLETKFGFPKENITALLDKDATRANILSTLNKISQKVGKEDRVFIFYAGHGSTEQLSSGRSLGYIIPVDSDPDQTSTQAIPMTDLQNFSEKIDARHVFFVMDACYSGLGLTRGGGYSARFLRDNGTRTGRQMLTAGGSNQLVADGGPNGHAVFTWTLIQALEGKADLNADGLITGTEIAAYVAPAVSRISQQTPAFGSLPGSEGGEFIFALSNQKEYLTESTPQLASEAVALNVTLDKISKEQTAPGKAIVVTNLEGKSETVTPAVIELSRKQKAIAASNRGLQFYKEKRYEESIQAFHEALVFQPDFAMAANNLGFAYFKQGKFAESVVWFENTLKLDPSRSVAHLNVADSWLALNDIGRAKSSYQTYLGLTSNGASSERVKEWLKKN